MSNFKPFNPAEAKTAKVNHIPNELIWAVNELLSERYKDHSDIHIKLKEVKARCKKLLGIDDMFSGVDPMDSWPQGVWDFESVYRAEGWNVSFDAPGYNETYDGYYIFSQKKDWPCCSNSRINVMINEMIGGMDVVYLSRRNLLALIAKLDANVAAADTSQAAIIKYQPANLSAPFRQSIESLVVVAVEDEVFYGALQRSAGVMHPREEANLPKPSTGVDLKDE